MAIRVVFVCLSLMVTIGTSQLVGFPSSSLTAPPVTAGHHFFPVQNEFQNAVAYNVPAHLMAPGVVPHRDVVVNSQHEDLLPPQYKNPFYKNPRIAEVLARESWFGPGETQVHARETEKIPRERIFSVLKNAGLARRR